jgi:hypothetical protein
MGRDLSTYALKQTLIMLAQSFVASGDLRESALNFTCSTTFMRRFLKRNGLSFRRNRSWRRPNLDDQEESEFVFLFHISFEMFGPIAMVNFDESSWRLVMVSERTVAERSAGTVNRFINGDVKATFAFFALVVADDIKVPSILVTKSKTTRCHKQFGRCRAYPHEIWHNPNGRCTEVSMVQYLHWLRTQIMTSEICLLLGQFNAQDTPTVHDEAGKLNIHVVFIPKGGTGKYQPLDRRVFGALKFKGGTKWARYYGANPGRMCTREIAADLLLTPWDELDNSYIVAGWDLGEDVMEDSSSSDDDEEWLLTLNDEPSDSEEEDEESEGLNEADDNPEEQYGYSVS